MALSGSFGGKTANRYIKPTITWSAVQSVAGNYSDITATLTYSRTNRGYTTSGTWKGELTIGQEVFSDSRYLEITYESNTVAITATARVYHDDYGILTAGISATGKISGTSLSETVISGEVTPDEIPRASTVTAPNGFIGSRTTVVVQRKNDRFTHTLAYRFGTLSGYIDGAGEPVQEPVQLQQTVVNFRIPEEFYGQIPDKPGDVCTLTCTTYLQQQVIGQPQTGVFQATAQESICRPLLLPQVEEGSPEVMALTGESGMFVRYLSVLRCRLTVMPRNGAQITGRQIDGEPGGQREIVSPEQGEVSFAAVDSRGYGAAQTLSVPMLPYVPLTLRTDARRIAPTSDQAVVTLQGSCWKGNFGAVENSLTVTVQVEDQPPVTVVPQISQEHTYEVQVPLSGLDYTRAYRLTLTAGDAAVTVSQEVTLQKGIPVFHWGDRDFCFQVPVEMPALTLGGVSLEDYIRNIVEEMQT